jgi:glycosyltransferase involved in cell wall biosynthesis
VTPLTILTLTYDSEAFVGDTIASVLSQSYQDFEILISDDGSTDATLEIVRGFSDARIRVVRTPRNLGPAGNYQHALDHAHGACVAFVNSDDVLRPGCLEKKMAVLDREAGVGVVHSNAMMIDEHGAETGATYFDPEVSDHRQRRGYTLKRYLLSDNRVCFPTVVARADLVRRAGGIDASLPHAHDWELMMRLACFTDFHYLAEPLVGYRWHASNHSHALASPWRRMREEAWAKAAVFRKLRSEPEFPRPVAWWAAAVAGARVIQHGRALLGARRSVAPSPLVPRPNGFRGSP